ncbi:MAG: EboA domain-containing protein [Planctomycetota bacterium]
MQTTEFAFRPADLDAAEAWLARAATAAYEWETDATRRETGAGECETRIDAVRNGADDEAFCLALSALSRYAARGPLFATGGSAGADAVGAESALGGWNPERWTALDAQRVRLIVARAQANDATLPDAMEEAFRYADEGELRALYRALQLLPGPERFLWRAKEGCRTNMKSVFEANGCDTVYPVAHFDDIAWRQLCMKALFIEAPLWRIVGFDGRVDDELARMALDLADERRAAGRTVNPELWMCLGATASERAVASIEDEIQRSTHEPSRKGAILALGRMGAEERLKEIERDGGTVFGPVAQWALLGRFDQTAYASISPGEVPA